MYPCDAEGKVFAKLFREFHGGKGIGTVAVSDELEVFWKFLKTLEGHTHSKDTRADSAVTGYLVTNNGAAGSVHDQPDVSFDTADFDIGFISHKGVAFAIGVVIYKRLDADSGSFAVVGDLLMGDVDIIKILEGLTGSAQRKAKVDMQGQAQRHDMGVMFAELEGRSVLGQGV